MGIQTVEQLRDLFAPFGVTHLYSKKLADKQDNEKNQIYLGSGLSGLANVFPAKLADRSASESTKKPKSASGDPKQEAQLDFAWLDRDGSLYPAPYARIIDYFQFPEIRLSGFMRGCRNPPDSLRRKNQSKYGNRILLLGTFGDKTVGLVLTSVEDELVASFPVLPDLRVCPTLQVLSLSVVPTKAPRDHLLDELREIHIGGWHPCVRLKPGESEPYPYNANNSGGYTVEALLGIPSNPGKAPDKHGYEVKSFAQGKKISLMTPTPDGGIEGELSFRDFMAERGWPKKNGDGSTVFCGAHKCNQVLEGTGCVLRVNGYDGKSDSFSSDTDQVSITLDDDVTGETIARWSFEKLANSWNDKHHSACYVCRESQTNTDNPAHSTDHRILEKVYMCEGTDIWLFLRAVASGTVFYDPGHEIDRDGKPHQRPQWRIYSAKTKLESRLKELYREVNLVSLL